MSDTDKTHQPAAPLRADAEVWEKIVHRPEFEQLLTAKARFIVPTCLFFLVYYFALIVVVGYFPELAKKKIGPANFAYWFALSQFFMSWIVAWVYVRAAGRFDQFADSILDEHVGSENSASKK